MSMWTGRLVLPISLHSLTIVCDRPMNDHERGMQDRYRGRQPDGLPMPVNQFREPQHEHTPLHPDESRRQDPRLLNYSAGM